MIAKIANRKTARALLTTAFVAAAAVGSKADEVTLKDGRTLRGVDYKKKGEGHLFTLEDGRTVFLRGDIVASFEKSPRGEKIEFRGKQVTLRRKIKTLEKERELQEKKHLRDIRVWARALSSGGGKATAPAAGVLDGKARAARDRIAALSAPERERLFLKTLATSEVREARLLAAERLAQGGAEGEADLRGVVGSLAFRAVTDRYKSVRDTCLLALKKLDLPQTAGHFTKYLKARSPQHRINAANALSVFPSRDVMPELINTFRYTWAGFARGFVFQGTQRAYIADYELVSGGTGFSIIEVADPVIQTSTTGVALDVDVRKVEMIARRRAMKKISGQDFGADIDKWKAWWEKEHRLADEKEKAGRAETPPSPSGAAAKT